MFNRRLLSLVVALSASGALHAQEATDDVSDDAMLEEVVVEGVRQAELNARQAERNKKIFSSVIAQDDAGNFADQNVAESLQRLPGITLQKSEGEGRFVTIRGLGPGFVSVNQNGREVASAGGDGREFALDALPSDLLGAIEVLKTLTPDQDLNSIGGTVNVKNISAFDRKKNSLKLKAQVVNQEYVNDLSPKLALSGTNLLVDETVGVGYALSWENRKSQVFQNIHHADNTPRFADYMGDVTLVPARFESREEDAERTRIAGSVTLEYRPTDANQFTLNYSRTEFEDIDIALREYHRWGQATLNTNDPLTPDRDESLEDEFWYNDASQNLYAFSDTDLQHQFFIQEGKSITDTLSLGAKHFFDGGWNLDYDLAASTSKWNKPGGRRAQFRIRDLAMVGTHGSNYYGSTIVSPEQLTFLSEETDDRIGDGTSNYGNVYLPNSRRQPNMVYDNLFLEDSMREDQIAQFNINLEKEFEDGFLTSMKVGLAAKDRERVRDKDRWSLDPESGPRSNACEVSVDPAACRDYLGLDGSMATYGDFFSFTPDHPDFQHNFITKEETEHLLAVTAPVGYLSDETQVNVDSTKDDYKLEEESRSAYIMAEFEPFDNASIITGVKYERTDFRATGNFAVRNDREDNLESGVQGDILVELPQAENSYGDILPSIHFNWEPTDELMYRAAIWTSFSRPSYGDSRNAASISSRVEFCDVSSFEDDYVGDFPRNCGEKADMEGFTDSTDYEELFNGNYYVSPSLEIESSNPTLRAMKATHLDTSISWYPSDNLYFQAALFYKNINDFIVTVRGADMALEDLPIDLPLDVLGTQMPLVPGTVYENVVLPINGDVAKVWGTELSFSQNFENGIFVFGNITLQDSEATLDESFRVDPISLPDQADQVVNLSTGWENDDFSLRLTANYRSEILRQIGACGAADVAADAELADQRLAAGLQPYPKSCQTWNDIYQDNTFSLDFKASWNVTDQIDIFLDATNLTGDYTLEYIEGDNALSNGKIMYSTEDYGSVYQVGFNIKFM